MLTGKVVYNVDKQTQFTYNVWGYAFTSNLSLVFDSDRLEALELFDRDGIYRQFQHKGRVVILNSTNVKVETVTDGTAANKPVKPTTKLPVQLGAFFSYMRTIGESNADFVETNKSDELFEYKVDTTYLEGKETKYFKSAIGLRRRSHGYDIKYFVVDSTDMNVTLQDIDTSNSKLVRFPYFKVTSTITFSNAKTKAILEEGHVIKPDTEVSDADPDANPLLNFEFTSKETARERGMFLNTLEEVEKRHPNKDFSWIRKQNYQMVTDANATEVVKHLMQYDELAVDTETTGVRITFKSMGLKQGPYSDLPVGYIICGKPGESFFFPLAMHTVPNLCNGDMALAFDKYIRPLLRKPTIYHNAAFDALVAFIFGQPTNLIMDTMVAFQNTYGYEKGKNFKVGLKPLTKRFLGRDSLDIEDLTRSGSYDNANFADVPEALVVAYACPDADNTLQLRHWIRDNNLLESHNANKVVDIDSQFALVIAYQKFWGMHIDTDRIPELNRELKFEMDKHMGIMKSIIEEVNNETIARNLPALPEATVFNPNSSVQVKRVAFEYLDIPIQTKRDKSSGETKSTLDKGARNKLLSILKKDSREYKFIKAFKDYNDSYTMVKNFTKNLDSIMSPDGFTFSDINQFLNTGRLSTKAPAYQNYSVPVKAYITGRKHFGMSDNDFQSIEYKVIAGLSGQPQLIKAFQDPNTDYHKLQAANMFKIPYELVTDAQRKLAKPINFGIPFGMGPESLGENLLGVRSPESTAYAEKMMKRYFSGQEKVKAFFDIRRRDAVRNGYSETKYGRRRYYNKRRQSIGSIRRAAGNQPIQGTAADSFKIAATNVYNYIVKNGLIGKILMPGFIHDEMLFEIHESIHPLEWLRIIKSKAELRLPGFPPFFLGWGYGYSWKEAKKIEVVTELQGILSTGDPYEHYPDWDGDAEKFNAWLKKRIVRYEIEKVMSYVTDAKNDNTVITSVIWGYLTEHIDEDKLHAPLQEQIQNFADLHVKDYKALEHVITLIDPSDAKVGADDSDESENDVLSNIELEDLDYTSDTVMTDEERERLERQREHDKIVDRLEIFGDFLDLKNKRVIFEYNPELFALAKFYKNKYLKELEKNQLTDNKPEEYLVTFYDKTKDVIMNTNAYITDTYRMKIEHVWLAKQAQDGKLNNLTLN